MPRLNRDGSLWCSGIAGVGFYGGDFVNDQPHVTVELHPAGMRAFLTDDEAVTQFSDAQVDAVNCRTGARRIVDPMGAGEVFSGGGEWASFLAGRGVRTSTGLVLPSAYVGAGTGPLRNDCVGPDGEMAIKEQYHSAGPWHLYARDGSRRVLSGGDAANIQLLGSGRYIYRVGWTWFGVGVLAPSPLTEPAWNLRYLETPEGWWTIYQENNGRVFAHPNGSPIGHVLGSAADAFGVDAVVLPDGRIRVIWATSEGEVPSSIVTAHFRLTDSRVPLVGATPPIVVVPPSPVDPPPTEPTMNYRDGQRDILPYLVGRWGELRIPEKTLALVARGVTDEEEFKAIQIPAFIQIVGELHHEQSMMDVGLSTKRTGNNWDGFATDIVTLKPINENGHPIAGNFQLVDALVSAGSADCTPTWNVLGENTDSSRPWATPPIPAGDAPPLPVPPDPVGATHQYIGGGNDTGTCDVCNQPRAAAVHATPASKIAHTYNGGEQDTGLCDVCGKTRADLLHREVLPGPAPAPVPEPEDPPVTHDFVGIGKFCSECGQGPLAPIHQRVVPPGKSDLAETNAILRDVLAAITNQTQKVEEIGAQLVAALKGGGGGILDGILKKRPK